MGVLSADLSNCMSSPVRVIPVALWLLAACVVCVAIPCPSFAAAARDEGGAPQDGPQKPPAPAEQPYPRIRIGTLTYLQYGVETENRDGYNAFDLTRGYLNIRADLTKRIRFRLTPDIRRVTDGSLAGSLMFRLKYGYAQFDNVTPRSWLRLGLQQTPWLDFAEGINRYRVQGTMFSEREKLIPGSADFGAGYGVALPDGAGDIHVGVYNGEGSGNPEVGKHKSFQGRVTIRPLGGASVLNGLRLSGFYSHGWYGTGLPRRLGIVMGSFEHRHVVSTLQWLRAAEKPVAGLAETTDRSGVSGFVEARQGPEGWAGFVRVDRFKPDMRAAGHSSRRMIVGVAYWRTWSTIRMGFVVNDEIVRHGRAVSRSGENRVLVQTHIEF
jgi:hypothetical protein